MKILILLAFCTDFVFPHCALWDPPSRQSIGKAQPSCKLPVISNHLGTVYCGGELVVHNAANKGRCGLCGDNFSSPNKDLYAGGKYATGTIAKSYLPGQAIDVQIKMFANHKGFFTFALCAHNNPNTPPSKQCFQRLKVNNGDLYYTPDGNGLKDMKVQLPAGLTCKQCILQMTYTAGNNWGVGPQSAEVVTEDCKSKQGKSGCGWQVINRACSDICIGSFCPQQQCAKIGDVMGGGVATPPVTPGPLPPVTPVPTTPAPQPKDMCLSAGIKKQYFSLAGDQYCKLNCLSKTMTQCYTAANTKYLCYCTLKSGRILTHPSVLLDDVNHPVVKFLKNI